MNKIMRNILVTVTTCLFMTSCGQNNPKDTQKADDTSSEKEIITSSKTAKHINIPGTRLFISQPDGFVLASNFIGLKKGESGMIQIYDLVGGNYYTNAATFSQSKFESKGAKVFEFKEFTFNNYPAKFISMQGEPQAKSFSLVFGDTTFSSMILAKYVANDAETEKQIKEALFSIVYDKKMTVDPFASAKFLLNDKESKFKFSKSSSGMFFYSLNGVVKNNYGNDPFITVTTLPLEGNNAQSVAEMMIANLIKYGLTDKQISNQSTNPVNGYKTFEFDMTGKIQNEKTNFYYLVVTDNEKAIVIQAKFNDNSKDALIEIKKLAHTVKIKS